MTRVTVFTSLLFFVVLNHAQAAQDQIVLVLPLPCIEVDPISQDRLLRMLAHEIRATYQLRVKTSREYGQAVFGLGKVAQAKQSFFEYVKKGKRDYHQLQIDQAQESLKAAKRLLTYVGPILDDSNLLVDLFLFSGLAYLATGKKHDASQSFLLAVVANPKFALSSSKYPPDIVKAFNSSRQSVLSGPAPKIRITTQPKGAQVYLDGRKRGKTPVVLSMYPGRHYLRLTLSGYADFTVTLPPKNPPKKIKHHMISEWKGNADALQETSIAREQLSSEATVLLRRIASFYEVSAIILVSFGTRNNSIHLGQRLFLAKSGKSFEARLFDLGGSRSEYAKKLRGIVSVLQPLQELGKKPEKKVIAKAKVEQEPIQEPEKKISHQTVFTQPKAKQATPIRSGPSTAWYKSWWFWTLTGTVLASAATVTTIYLLQPEGRWNLTIQPKE